MATTDLKLVHNGEKSLPERVADQLMNLIRTQELQAGDKLPNEFELAKQLQVGRGSIREAVKILVARNVLEIQRGKGTFIARHTGETKDPLGFAFCSDQFQLAFDLLEVLYAAGTVGGCQCCAAMQQKKTVKNCWTNARMWKIIFVWVSIIWTVTRHFTAPLPAVPIML